MPTPLHDNPPDVPAVTFALPDHHVISLIGRDAVAFAQAQFMNDVATLASGQWQWSGWLTAKGRVIALFALLRLDNETVWLLLPDADAPAMAAALQRVVFRSKVVITARGDLVIAGAFAMPDSARGARLGGIGTALIELDMGADGGPRRLRIGVDATGDGALPGRWLAFDLSHGLPRLPTSQVEHWTPQQLSLERLGAFSVKKGCYPGQEIVARTHFLGKAKRGLALLENAEAIAPGAQVHGDETSLGTVVAAASSGSGCVALAVLPLERRPQALVVDGLAVLERPLLGGLAR